MAASHPTFTRLCVLAADDSRFDELEAELLTGSNLPGPRANLTLAAAFADCIGASHASHSSDVVEAQWALLTRWLAIAEDEAPTGTPREFLPFCATLALGAVYPTAHAARQEEIADRLRELANDGRWRIREAVTIALQRIGEWYPPNTMHPLPR